MGSLALSREAKSRAVKPKIWFCASLHGAYLAAGIKILRDGVLLWLMKTWKMQWFSCFLPLHVLFHPCSRLDLSIWGEKRKKKKNTIIWAWLLISLLHHVHLPSQQLGDFSDAILCHPVPGSKAPCYSCAVLPSPREVARRAADERDINKRGECSVFSEGEFSCVLSRCAKW